MSHATSAPPMLAGLDPATRAVLDAEARELHLPKGARAFESGAPPRAFLIVLEGSVSVRLTAESGREIVLYRVEAGESCVLTTSALLDSEAYAAEAICDSDVTALALPAPAFRALMGSSASFRDAVLAAYASRVTDLILTLEETQFQRVDARLAQLIATRAAAGPLLATHQALAVELGTAREVVSRALKRFERAGAVALGRGAIELRDAAKLKAFAGRV